MTLVTDMSSGNSDKLIGLVGPCAAGKSTIVTRYTLPGFKLKAIAQEHSYVQDMWLKMTNPDFLIYLHVSYPITIQRNKLSWSKQEYDTQVSRLSHAYRHADLVIDTDILTPTEVFHKIKAFIAKQNQ